MTSSATTKPKRGGAGRPRRRSRHPGKGITMLKGLIAEAIQLGGGNLCEAGHAWESEGGRTCPKYENAGCSQTVYVCQRCGAYDYGYKGGPAHKECFSDCRRDFADEIAEDAEYAAEAALSTDEAIRAKQGGEG